MKFKNLFYFLGFFFIYSALCLFINNVEEDREVKADTAILLEGLLREDTNPLIAENLFLYKDMDMPARKVEGMDFIGTLKIDSLHLHLPVLKDWSYKKIKRSPARYKGSVYEKNLIILAHNYNSHFGKIHLLDIGDKVEIQDISGNSFVYNVSKKEELNGEEIKKLEEGDWDLTLFTCTLGGQKRVAIRCKSVNY